MSQKIYILPVKCRGCGVMFDLWPILQEQEKVSGMNSRTNQFARLLKQSFCPDCKRAVLLGMAEQEAFEFEEPELADEEAEIEMMLEIE